MNDTLLHLALAASAGLFVGTAVGWLTRAKKAAMELQTAEGNWQPKLEQAAHKVKESEGQAASLKASLQNTQRLVLKSKHEAATAGTEIESLRERHEKTARTLSATRAERDEYANRLSQQQRFVLGAKQRIDDLNEEFSKSRDFYKAQLGSAIEQRHALERKIETMKSEQQSLTALLTAPAAQATRLKRAGASTKKTPNAIASSLKPRKKSPKRFA